MPRRRRPKARRKSKLIAYSQMIGYRCFFDGCCEPTNPGGNAGFGMIIYCGARMVHEQSGMIEASPQTTNNVAEYAALDLILDWFIASDLMREPIAVFGDSNLVIQQCFGTWKIRGGHYAEKARQVKAKLKMFTNIHGSWIPREENSVADDLSKAHLRKANVEFRIQPE